MEKTTGLYSMTARVKEYVMEYMNQNDRDVERQELVKYINAGMGDEERLTDGVIAGAIKILINSGELVTVRRGCYRKGTENDKPSCFERIYNFCSKFSTDLDRVCTVNILDLTEEEREVYPVLVKVLEDGKQQVSNLVAELDAVLEMAASRRDWIGTVSGMEMQNETSGMEHVNESAAPVMEETSSDMEVSSNEGTPEQAVIPDSVPSEEQQMVPEKEQVETESAGGKKKATRKKNNNNEE